MILNTKFHEILFISSRATLATKFLSHTHRHTDRQTHRHFPEIVKSCSGHPKTCKSIENWKSKICTKPILPSTYIEESNKHVHVLIFKNIFSNRVVICEPTFVNFCNFAKISFIKSEEIYKDVN